MMIFHQQVEVVPLSETQGLDVWWLKAPLNLYLADITSRSVNLIYFIAVPNLSSQDSEASPLFNTDLYTVLPNFE
jgi:hypothetical protein